MLLVGEDPRTATTIVEMLRAVWPQGLLITQAPCIPDAVQELSDHGDSCVLLTLRQQDDPLAPLRDLATAAPAAPIVVLSDHDDAGIGVAAVQAGAQDHLSASELHPALLARCVRYAIERKRAEVRLTRRALQDPLTGLPNRLLFRDRVSVALDRSQRTGLAPAVMFLDLDSFKEVNDTLGHTAGDRVLHELSDRFTALLRPMDTVARIGGDEFTFLFEGLSGEAEAMAIAQRIADAVAEPIMLEGREEPVVVAVSIGITMLEDPSVSLDDALRDADGAMYRAKRLGGGRAELARDRAGGGDRSWSLLAHPEERAPQAREEGAGPSSLADPDLVAFAADPVPLAPAGLMLAEDPRGADVDAESPRGSRPRRVVRWADELIDDPLSELAHLTAPLPASDEAAATELRAALDHGELRVHYQPRVTIRGQTGLTGFEALVRWQHPRRGLLAPAQFLGLAEDSGLIGEIGDWVIGQALERIRRWRRARPGVSVSVNISPAQLADPGFPARLGWAIERAGGDPGVLWLEIAADALLDPRFDAGALHELADLGVHVAIDDFGVGPATLHDLRELPVAMLKIHQSFVTELGDDPGDAPLVGAVVELGHTLGLTIVAEGVESDHQLARLRDLGCDGAQGFLFSQPVPEESVGEMLGLA
ncbi:MAG TPA: GGDEF domain-containing response regulator [Solirubrobacteraceae bacterium]|nr:GGDEF domain-containing response regulator [Solirubrobacteraceae bacterium]